MKKLMIPLIVGLVIGLGASTGAIALLGGGPEPLTESLEEALGEGTAVPDEAAHDAVPEHDGMEEHELAGREESLPEGALALLSTGSGQEHGAPAEVQATAVDSTAGPTPPAGWQGSPIETGRLGKLFGSMQARDAARVLEHMDDYEVQVILGQLGNREAAAILSNLSPERAAVISRSVIRGERSHP